MAPEDIGPRLNELIDRSDILDGSFSIEAGLMLASILVKNPKTSAALAWSSLGYSAGARLFKQYQRHIKSKQKDYVVKIGVDDPIAELLSQWILQETPEEEQHTVEAQRIYRAKPVNSYEPPSEIDAMLDEILGARTSPPAWSGDGYQNFTLEVEDDRPMPLTIDGHELSVTLVVPGNYAGQDGNDQSQDSYDGSAAERYRGDPHFLVTCPSLPARKAFLAKVDASFKADETRVPAVWRTTPWGDMERVGDVPPRRLDTVVVKPGQLEALVDDITTFLRNEKYYLELDLPYHRGVLLYGPPGTGKTSIAAAVATTLNLDVYAVRLSNVPDDDTLEKIFHAVKPRSVLLLEDIDTCTAARGKDNKKSKGVTIDGLLQTLDGFAAPHGLVTIMTTNNPDTLDDRLVREGRVDTRLEIDCVDTEQVNRLCTRFLGYVPEGIPKLVPSDMISPAKVVDVFKKFLYDKEGAGPALVKRLNTLLDAEKVR